MLTQGFALANNPEDFVELFVSFDPKDPFLHTKRRILRFLGVEHTDESIFVMQVQKHTLSHTHTHTHSLSLSLSLSIWRHLFCVEGFTYHFVSSSLHLLLWQRKGKIPRDLLTSLRVHTMKPSEFDSFKRLESGRLLSLQNELDVSREVLLTCQKSLQAFPTSVKEDDEILLMPGGLDRRKAYAVLYRRSEKLVYIEAMHAITESWNNILFSGDDS